MAREAISYKTKMQLWGLTAGRCEICNKILCTDSLYGDTENFGEFAHIKAVESKGPRHDDTLSATKLNSIENLMLLCAEHHKLVDSKPEDYPVDRLIEIKRRHEERIRVQTEINSSCQIVSYFMDIDRVDLFNNEDLFRQAVIKSMMYPKTNGVIALHNKVSTSFSKSARSMCDKAKELEDQVQLWYKQIVGTTDAVAVFALAPQPLLFKLGSLLPDQLNVRVYQCHREGDKWAWPDDNSSVQFYAQKTLENSEETIALVIDVSAQIIDSRVTSVLGDKCSIYHLTIENPNRTFVKNEVIQNEFIKSYRGLLEQIKNDNPKAKMIHLFPAMPNSLAIRAGMDVMTKVDLPLLIYDQLRQEEGFVPTITIGG